MAVRMLFLSALLVGGAMVVCSGWSKSQVETTQDAVLYLRKYGYLSAIPSEDEAYHVTEDEMEEAICHFQYMFNLDETCKLDEKTLAMMNVPRCGVPDVKSHEIGLRKPKRYNLWHNKWSKTDISYSIESYTDDLPISDVRAALHYAFNLWAEASNINMYEDGAGADITINFVTGDHGDGDAFDGRGGVLAHASFPEGGIVHFDDDEIFGMPPLTPVDTNLIYLAVHEFGHSLGLNHSGDREAVMYAYITSKLNWQGQLSMNDIAGIQALYGARD